MLTDGIATFMSSERRFNAPYRLRFIRRTVSADTSFSLCVATIDDLITRRSAVHLRALEYSYTHPRATAEASRAAGMPLAMRRSPNYSRDTPREDWRSKPANKQAS